MRTKIRKKWWVLGAFLALSSLLLAAPRPVAAQQESYGDKAEVRERMEDLEAQQPPGVRRDKYMMTLSRLLKEQKFAEALPYFDKLNALDVEKDPLLDYYHGEALYRTGQPDEALQVLYRYVETQGSDAPLYGKTLDLIIKIESE